MGWFNKFLGSRDAIEPIDYYAEGVALMQTGRHHEALTSFRLALKESPGDSLTLQQIAMAYTRIGMREEAAKTYRHVLQKDPSSAGAHYGLAFLLMHRGDERAAADHLRAFLDSVSEGPGAQAHVDHARQTLRELSAEPSGVVPANEAP